MTPICRNCHFLAKEYREGSTGRSIVYSLSAQEREKAALSPAEMVAAPYALNCHMGVWDEGVSGSVGERGTTVNVVKRATGCFFFPHHPAMLFTSARELQKRADDNEQMKKSNSYVRAGLWVAAGALVVALVAYLKSG